MSNFQNLGYFADILFSKMVLEHNAVIIEFLYFGPDHNFVSINLILYKKGFKFFSIDTLSNNNGNRNRTKRTT